MSKIKDISMLREFALDTLEKLQNGDIDVTEAGVTGKLCEGVISTVKAQLEYSKMIQQEPNIPFMKVPGTGKSLESEAPKKLLSAPR